MFKKLFIVGAALLVTSSAFAAEGVTELKVKNYQVYAIDDAQNTFNTSIFPNIQEQPDKLELMPNGKAAGVYRTYLALGKDKIMLFDSGWGNNFSKKGQTVSVLREKGIAPEMVTDIYMTHLDGDHVSGLINGEEPTYPKAKIHMSQAEYDGWLVRGDARNPRSVVLAREILKLYDGRIETFAFGSKVEKNLLAVDTSGHTIGHTAYQFGKGKKGLLIVGDVLHVEPLQLRFTDFNSRFDQDWEQAAATRERVLSEAAKSKITIAGMHFKSIGKVKSLAEGGYSIEK